METYVNYEHISRSRKLKPFILTKLTERVKFRLSYFEHVYETVVLIREESTRTHFYFGVGRLADKSSLKIKKNREYWARH